MRENTQKASAKYFGKPPTHHREELQKCKSKLQQTYDVIAEEELDEMLREVESADVRSKHRESWRLINQITGRKSAKRSIIKANNKEDRINK